MLGKTAFVLATTAALDAAALAPTSASAQPFVQGNRVPPNFAQGNRVPNNFPSNNHTQPQPFKGSIVAPGAPSPTARPGCRRVKGGIIC
jgi:hypothetical protein